MNSFLSKNFPQKLISRHIMQPKHTDTTRKKGKIYFKIHVRSEPTEK